MMKTLLVANKLFSLTIDVSYIRKEGIVARITIVSILKTSWCMRHV